MTKVVIIGTGNVARHLFDAFRAHSQLKVVQVIGRSHKALTYFKKWSETSSNFGSIREADVYIIAISDDAIPTVSERLNLKNKLIVHTSGSVAQNALPKNNRRGVFYPVQTFSKGRRINLKNVPICIEAEGDEDLKTLRQLAASISDQVYEISSEQRKSLHLAAVFVNNFTNHMYHIGYEICQENGLPFNLLEPLIQETSGKIKKSSPFDAQTGPARRHDEGTMRKHIELLRNANHKKIYSLLGKSIQDIYGEKL